MLLPKGKHKTFVPVMEHFWLPSVLGKLAPPERRAMAEIVDNAEVLTVDGAIWLLIPRTKWRWISPGSNSAILTSA